MDPMNRKHVWSMIEKLKVNRAVVLTTHAMEEADALARRLKNSRTPSRSNWRGSWYLESINE